jgi:hypothetical protein
VFLNNRKAKLVASYELKLVVGWKGTTAGGEEGRGTIEVPVRGGRGTSGWVWRLVLLQGGNRHHTAQPQ